MAQVADELDLASLQLASGAGRRLEVAVHVAPVELSGERYEFHPDPVPVRLSVSRMTGEGYALRLDAGTRVSGRCMRCLKDAERGIELSAREVDVPSGGEELDSPYVADEKLDLVAWVHDALALAMPAQLLCRDDCAGLCPVCAVDLNEAGPDHHHERVPDPRWAKLGEIRFE